jgi:outer membrane protein OmpA-like peptidoglycan-associated protein
MRLHLILILIAIYSLTLKELYAQKHEPPVVKGITRVARNKATLPFTTLKVVEVTKLIGLKSLAEKEITQIQSDKKGHFEFTIDYNKYYRIYCSHPNYLPLFFDIDSKIPANIKTIEDLFGINEEVDFFKPEDSDLIKLEMFEKYPYNIFKFKCEMGKNITPKGFEPDKEYRKKFESGIYRDIEWEKEQKKLAANEANEKAEQEAKQKAEQEEQLKRKTYQVKAKVYLKDNGTTPLPDAKIIVFTENPTTNLNASPAGNFMANKFGTVLLKGLKINQTYFILLDEVDEKTYQGFKLKNKNNEPLTNQDAQLIELNGKKYAVLTINTDQLFFEKFENFAEGITISGNLMVGEKEQTPLSNIKVVLKDAANKIIQHSYTNLFGGFAFTNVNPDEKYIITVDEIDPTLVANKKVSIINSNGQTIFQTTANANGQFKFEILPTDHVLLNLLEVDDASVNISLKGRLLSDTITKQPIADIQINLLSSDGKPLSTSKTNENGYFIFENITADAVYLINVDETNPKLKSVTKIYLQNTNNKTIKELTIRNSPKFTFKLLPHEHKYLQTIEVEDPWINLTKNKPIGTTIAEPIYFKSGDDHILNEATFILNKVVNIMNSNPKLVLEVSAHTDAIGSDNYNMELSKRRAKAAVDYLISKGINEKRLVPIGYGETKLLNSCRDNVKCSEAEHAQNRRLEFKILSK